MKKRHLSTAIDLPVSARIFAVAHLLNPWWQQKLPALVAVVPHAAMALLLMPTLLVGQATHCPHHFVRSLSF
jgi:hypothetical protein